MNKPIFTHIHEIHDPESAFLSMYAEYKNSLTPYNPSLKDASPMTAPEMWLWQKQSPNTHFAYMQNENGKNIGLCIYTLSYNEKKPYLGAVTVRIEEFYITEAEQRKGYGEMMFKELINAYSGAKVTMEIYSKNRPARYFWTAMFSKYRISIEKTWTETYLGADMICYLLNPAKIH